MTIERTLTAIIGRCEALLANMPAYREAREMLEPSPLRASRTDQQRFGKGGHGDPTLGSVITTLDDPRGEDFTDAVVAARTTLDWAFDVQRQDIASTRRRPRTDKEQRDYEADIRDGTCQCTRPQCPNQWETPPGNGTRWAGYSKTCADRERTAERRSATGAGFVAATVVETARVTDRAPVEPMAPMRPVAPNTVTCQTCRTDYQLPLGIDLQTWHTTHKAECVNTTP